VEEVPLQRDTVVGSDRVRVVLLWLNNERVERYLVASEVKLLVVVVVVLRNVDPVEVVGLIPLVAVWLVYLLDWRVVVVVNGLALCLVL